MLKSTKKQNQLFQKIQKILLLFFVNKCIIIWLKGETFEEQGEIVCHIRKPDNSGVPIWYSEKPHYYWEDKAGGYGIQDPFGMKAVKEISGDFYNVVGLPVSRVCQVLKEEFGIDI